jgi:pyruvate dehydrogenase E1 component beta subunit
MADASKMNTIAAINLALSDAMERDEKVITLGEDIGDEEGGGVVHITKGLSTKFGEMRVKTTPISEQAIIGSAIGAAIEGYKPVAEIMLMNFLTVGMDMIVNHAAKLRYMSGGQTSVPLVIRCMTGAGMSSGGQHSDYLEAWFAHTAGMKVVAPSTPADAYGLMLSCIDDPDPCLYVENIPTYWTAGPAPERGKAIPLGKAKVTREGKDLTIVSYSRTALEALGAAAKLEEQGISAEVIDLRTIMPWDKEAVFASVEKTGRLLVAHEAVQTGGFGGEIAAVVQDKCWQHLKGPVGRIGAPWVPVPFSQPLEQAFLVNADKIVEVAKKVMTRNAEPVS